MMTTPKGKGKKNKMENLKKLIRVNIGCGSKLLPWDQGWINVDIMSPPEVILEDVAEISSFPFKDKEINEKTKSIFLQSDLRELAAIETGSVHEVHAYHVIEHFAISEINLVLSEIRRILDPNLGVFVCEQPDIIKCAKNFLQIETTKNNHTWHRLGLLGFYGEPDSHNPHMQHKWGWYPASLSEVLVKCGFKTIFQQPALTHMKDDRDFRLVAFVHTVPENFGKTPAPTAVAGQSFKGLGIHNGVSGKTEQLLIQPRDSVPEKNLLGNIQTNLKLMDKWLQRTQTHSGTAFIVSAGPSLKDQLTRLKAEYDPAKGDTIFCVKHSLPVLIEAGITPDFCSILDPRPLEGISTHGIVRKDLFKTIPSETKFLVASMTNPEVTQYLIDKGANIIGWHAYASGIDRFLQYGISLLITGGTSAGMRTVNIAYNLGFRNITLIGFDSSMEKSYSLSDLDKTKLDADGRKKYVEIFYKDPKYPYYSSGELAAQLQDLQTTFNNPNDIIFDMWCSGLGNEVWKEFKQRFEIPEYSEDSIAKSQKVL